MFVRHCSTTKWMATGSSIKMNRNLFLGSLYVWVFCLVAERATLLAWNPTTNNAQEGMNSGVKRVWRRHERRWLPVISC